MPAIARYCRGEVIDLGCGDMPYKDVVLKYATRYDSLDVTPCSTEVTFSGDIQDLGCICDASYDAALCLEVLEHVPDPLKALQETHRILKEDGILIVSVPHLSRVHDEPHDYFRFTHYGLRVLLERAGFSVMEIRERGGLFSFLGHQFSSVFLAWCWEVPLVHSVAFYLNKWCVVRPCCWVDRYVAPRRFPLGYTCVARKKPR